MEVWIFLFFNDLSTTYLIGVSVQPFAIPLGFLYPRDYIISDFHMSIRS